MIEVYVYDINGNCIFKEAGYKKIAELLKTKRSTIINACNSHYLFANKYIILNSKNLDTLPEMLIFAKKYIENLKKPTIFQYSLDGKFIASYTTYKEAAKATGFNIGNIGQSCSGIALRVNKYFFLKTTDAAAIQERVNRIRASSYCIVKKDIVNLNLIIEDKKKEK